MRYIINIKRHPFGGKFLAINLFGFIFTRHELLPRQLLHELIHSRQQMEMLYLPFFLWYVVEWVVRCCVYRDRMKAYYNISFEREAYLCEKDENYLKDRHMYAWIKYLRQS